VFRVCDAGRSVEIALEPGSGAVQRRPGFFRIEP